MRLKFDQNHKSEPQILEIPKKLILNQFWEYWEHFEKKLNTNGGSVKIYWL